MDRVRGWQSPVLSHLLREPPLQPDRGSNEWVVVLPGSSYREGLIGDALQHLRTRRLRLHLPEPLRELADALGVQTIGDATLLQDGSLLIRAKHSGEQVMMRLSLIGSDAPLKRASVALETFGPKLEVVPDLIAMGSVDGLTAAVESRLPGRRPNRLEGAIVNQVSKVVRHAAEITPQTGSTASHAVEGMVAAITLRTDPVHSRIITDLGAAATEVLEGSPSGFQHGDLWFKNLLVDRGQLSGVVDWDSWTAEGVPGVDLLGLVATSDRLRLRMGVGEAVSRRVWRNRAETLKTMGLASDQLDAIGIAWWLTVVDGTLRRNPARSSNNAWLDRTIGEAARVAERGPSS